MRAQPPSISLLGNELQARRVAVRSACVGYQRARRIALSFHGPKATAWYDQPILPQLS